MGERDEDKVRSAFLHTETFMLSSGRWVTYMLALIRRTIDDMDSRMGFANFVTRGKVLGQEEDAKT
jgi:hypothetical protein